MSNAVAYISTMQSFETHFVCNSTKLMTAWKFLDGPNAAAWPKIIQFATNFGLTTVSKIQYAQSCPWLRTDTPILPVIEDRVTLWLESLLHNRVSIREPINVYLSWSKLPIYVIYELKNSLGAAWFYVNGHVLFPLGSVNPKCQLFTITIT
jgi:hypothetical protein